MLNGKKLLALIPARGGSKRVPGKNLAEVCGRPMIEWTIRAATMSNYIDSVVVSTDDSGIADIATCAGARVPFIRPFTLSTDTATSLDVINHSLNYLSEIGENYEYLVLLQPTSPFRTESHIDECAELFSTRNMDSIVSVVRIDYPPDWNYSVDKELRMTPDIPSSDEALRSQDYPDRYRPNGAIYLIRVPVYREFNSLYPSGRVHAYEMNKLDSIEVDDEEDLMLVRAMVKHQKEGSS